MADAGTVQQQDRVQERDKLNKLLHLLDYNSSFLDEAKKRIARVETQRSIHLTSRMNTMFIDKWPEPKVVREQTVLYPSRNDSLTASTRLIGGTPINLETAIALRKITQGSALHQFSPEWRKSSLAFHFEDSLFPYGLQTIKSGSQGLALCVQGYVLKHLLFAREYVSSLFAANLLQPSNFERRRCLQKALAEILWQAGRQQRACVCLLQDTPCFPPDNRHRADNITEKLYLFEFKKYDDLEGFFRRNLDQFDNKSTPGCILFLYSVILSRTFPQIYQDLGVVEGSRVKLLTDLEDCTQPLINLLLTGRAVKCLHNGDLLYDSHGSLLSKPLQGVESRCEIGFLFWDRGEEENHRTEVGSMLKTPKYPIWVTKVNDQFGLLFSNNPDLVSDWRAENHFVLYYFTGLSSQHAATVLNIDTRISRLRPKTGMIKRHEEEKVPPLNRCIATKWPGAAVNWNGTLPFL